ncbi:rab3 GTPase-activating protein catalytic subunit-like isoform X1 [Rhagoletis pomonella]|uniref:rab3 GTPase-activating protein catalytic subunit-like isoform X1 n=3 Tax=Rhagoletis pomonella TaxID=28610 RepID=UPI001785B2FD|nr:rab3 GTPase-activating protein catalytic subunit-like isoform X1 [Rhagoletis pomonella]
MSLPLYESSCENNEFLNIKKFIALPCGYFPDACTQVYLGYDWLEVPESGAIDSPLHSDFVPSKSHNCIHSDKGTLETYIGQSLTEYPSGSEKSLPHITDPHLRRFRLSHLPEDSNFLKGSNNIAGPLNENELRHFLAYLFPDLYPDVAKYSFSNDPKEMKEYDMHRIKSAMMDSLSWRLSCLLATCNAHYGGKSGLAQLWAAFTRELRFIWDTRLSIQGPGIRGSSDALGSVISQFKLKLQKNRFAGSSEQSTQSLCT